MSVAENINNGVYNTKLAWPKSAVVPEEKDRVQAERNVYREDQNRLNNQFHADLAAEYGFTDHPKEGKLFALSWEHGHSSGLGEVVICYDEFSELLS